MQQAVTRNHKQRQGVALPVAIVILVALSAIAFAVIRKASIGIKQAGLDRSAQSVRRFAESEMERVADWMQNWYGNDANGSDPNLFVDDPTTKPMTHKTGGDYHHIELDNTITNPILMINDLQDRFRAVLNEANNYPTAYPGWSSPESINWGVFSYKDDGNMTSRVWASPVRFDGNGFCNLAGANEGIACKELINYGSNPAVPTAIGLRITLNATTENKNDASKKIALKRRFWLVSAQNANTNVASNTGKHRECSHCHERIYGGMTMSSNHDLRPISPHSQYLFVTGPGVFAGRFELFSWPSITAPLRKVDCSDPVHNCFTDSYGDVILDTLCEQNDPDCKFEPGEAYNGTTHFKDLQENVSDPTLIAQFEPVLDFKNKPKGSCPSYEPDCGVIGEMKKYVHHYSFELGDTYQEYADDTGDQAYIEKAGSANLWFSTGKKGDITNDPYVEDPTEGLDAYSEWIGPTSAVGDKITKSFSHDKYVAAADDTRTTHPNPTAKALKLEGSTIIDGELNFCGDIIIEGDLVVNDVTYDIPDGCPFDYASLIVTGNAYFIGEKFVHRDYPDVTTAGGQPSNGKVFVPSDFSTDDPPLALLVGHNVMMGQVPSMSNLNLAVPVMNDDAATTIQTPTKSGTLNFFEDKSNFNPLYTDAADKEYTGFLTFDNPGGPSDKGGPREDMVPFYYYTGTTGNVDIGSVDDVPVAYNGILPRGGTLVTDFEQWNEGGDGNIWVATKDDGAWITGNTIVKLSGKEGLGGAEEVFVDEDVNYINTTHVVHAAILASNIMAHNRANDLSQEGGEPLADPTDTIIPPWPATAELFDADGDGFSHIGVMATPAMGNMHLFNTGGTYVYAHPGVLNLPFFQAVVRDMVASNLEIAEHP